MSQNSFFFLVLSFWFPICKFYWHFSWIFRFYTYVAFSKELNRMNCFRIRRKPRACEWSIKWFFFLFSYKLYCIIREPRWYCICTKFCTFWRKIRRNSILNFIFIFLIWKSVFHCKYSLMSLHSSFLGANFFINVEDLLQRRHTFELNS